MSDPDQQFAEEATKGVFLGSNIPSSLERADFLAPFQIKFSRIGVPLGKVLSFLVCLVVFYQGFLEIKAARFAHDDSLNYQTSLSLAENFIYKNTYRPQSIYGMSISTNGPIQYFMAAAIKAFGIDTAKVVVLTIISATVLFSIYWQSAFAAAILGLLQLFWVTFYICNTHFLGEVTAVIFCLWGWYFLRKAGYSHIHKYLALSGVFWGFAIATKLVVFALVLFLVPVGVFQGRSLNSWKDLFGGLRKIAFCVGVALCVFVATFYFSVAHSLLVLHWTPPQNPFARVLNPGLLSFIQGHFEAVGDVERVDHNPIRFLTFNPELLPLLIVSALISCWKNRASVFFFGATLLMISQANLNERRVFPFLFFFIFLGCEAFSSLLSDWLTIGIRLSHKRFVLIFFLGLAITGLWSFEKERGGRTGTFTSRVAERTAPVSAFTNLIWTEGKVTGSIEVTKGVDGLIEIIKSAKYPILTSGFWQFPELYLRTHVPVYDRMEPENEGLTKAYEHLYLLFNPTNQYFPRTDMRLCKRVIFETEGSVFCEFDMLRKIAEQ